MEYEFSTKQTALNQTKDEVDQVDQVDKIKWIKWIKEGTMNYGGETHNFDDRNNEENFGRSQEFGSREM